jgi:hypothetical protein
MKRPVSAIADKPDDIDAIIKERTTRSAQERALSFDIIPIKDVGAPRISEKNNVDTINIKQTGDGTSADYLAARIARDNPELHERLKSGKFKSVSVSAAAKIALKPSH